MLLNECLALSTRVSQLISSYAPPPNIAAISLASSNFCQYDRGNRCLNPRKHSSLPQPYLLRLCSTLSTKVCGSSFLFGLMLQKASFNCWAVKPYLESTTSKNSCQLSTDSYLMLSQVAFPSRIGPSYCKCKELRSQQENSLLIPFTTLSARILKSDKSYYIGNAVSVPRLPFKAEVMSFITRSGSPLASSCSVMPAALLG